MHDNILLEGKMSKIEKDLFLDYLKEMYELILEKNDNENYGDHSSDIEDEEIKVKSDKSGREKLSKNVKEGDLRSTPELPQYEMVEMTEEYSGSNGHASSSTKNADADDSLHKKVVSESIENLFSDKTIYQQSYRFSQTPVSDISKALGINDKILIINKLFNKDQQDFNYVSTKLNYFNSYDEAAQYLKTEVAEKYNWDKESKKEKAIDFIKLVKRKYPS